MNRFTDEQRCQTNRYNQFRQKYLQYITSWLTLLIAMHDVYFPASIKNLSKEAVTNECHSQI